MSRDSISESRFGNRTGHTCIKSRNKPSGRFQEAVSSNVGWKNEAAIAPPFDSWCRDRPSGNVPLGLLVIALVWIGPILACGSFQPRPTPTRQLPVAVSSSNTPTPEQPASTTVPTAAPTPTATVAPPPTPTLVVPNPLTIGEQARIVIPGGLNIREQPSVGAPILTLLAQGKRILVLEGPRGSEGYVWWKVDDNQGNVGWVAGGQGDQVWISPQVGDLRPIDRSPIIGDLVVVTLQGELSVRSLPGLTSVIKSRARTNERYTVLAGPQAADGYFWYQIRSENGQVEGWAADGNEGERWLSPLE
jgi:hypothetical protein